MCHRVGTGMSDMEKGDVRERLSNYFQRYNLEDAKKGKGVPPMYRISGHATERPDVFISDPNKSIVVQVGDVLARLEDVHKSPSPELTA